MSGALVAAVIGDVLSEWETSGYWPPHRADKHHAAGTIPGPCEAVYGPSQGQERPSGDGRLTASLHAHHCHPDYTYAVTTGAHPLPPSTSRGIGWVENVEWSRHGRGAKPSCTSWMWRRPKDQEQP